MKCEPGQQVVTTLFFNGQCEQALAFYVDKLEAQIIFSIRFNQSPAALPEEVLQKGFESKIMHAQWQLGTTRLFASDGYHACHHHGGYSLVLQVESEAGAKRYFAALAEGGEVNMPLAPTFWSPLYGLVTDQFGISWTVMVPAE